MTPLEAAVAYAARGWRVVPLIPGKRAPWLDEWQNAATTDPDTIRAWWQRQPGSGVGIATGQASGIIIIDIDPRNGGDDSLADLEATYGPLPDTVEAITGSNGRHIYLNAPNFPISIDHGRRLGPGIDILGERAQAVAPPTIRNDGGLYTWDLEHDPFDGIAVADPPAWLLELLTATTTATPRRDPAPRPDGAPRPGDIFNQRHTWPDLLQPDGWTLTGTRVDHRSNLPYELWTRPGKQPGDGASATLYYAGSDVLKVFTSSVPGIGAGETMDRFGYWARTRHSGDVAEAARQYSRHLDNETDQALIGGSDNSGNFIPPQVTPLAPAVAPKPRITVNSRHLDEIAAEIVGHLDAANEPPTLFVRAGRPTRIRADEHDRPLIETLDTEHLRLRAAEVARFVRTTRDGATPVSPPLDAIRAILAARHWPFPALIGITEAPILRPDGTWRTEHGYDPATRLHHWHHGPNYPTIPDTPTGDQLADAVATIDDLFADFPWDTIADRANAWGLLITPLLRPAIAGQVPLALLDAPEPGTGKSLLAEIITCIATGRPAAMQPMPTDTEELEKRITTLLLAGVTHIVFDNVEGTIRNHVLAAALTSETWQGRILGRSEKVDVAQRATWLATGNNIDVGGDLARRCYRIRLDARQAQPWKRSGFRHNDLLGHVRANRPTIVAALCTIIRSWWIAGQPQADIAAMGGFTGWARTVGGVLGHAGIDGFLANLDAFHAEADTDAQAWEGFLFAWHERWADQVMTTAEIATRIDGSDPVKAALPPELAGVHGTPKFTLMLGRALTKRAGRHFGADGLHLVRHPQDRRRVLLVSVSDGAAGFAGLKPDADGEKPQEFMRGVLLEETLYTAVVTSPDQVLDEGRGVRGVRSTNTRNENNETQNGGKQPREPRNPARTDVRSDEADFAPSPLDDLFGPRSNP